MSPPVVFVSYSRDTDEHHDEVLALASRLRDDGVDARLDSFVASPPEGWPKWTLEQFEAARFVILVCTPSYRRSFEGKSSEAQKNVAWEGMLAAQHLYDAASNAGSKLVPVLLAGADEAAIPAALRAYTRYRLPDGYEALYRHLTAQPEVVPTSLGPRKELPARSIGGSSPSTAPTTGAVVQVLSAIVCDSGSDESLRRALEGLGISVVSVDRDVAAEAPPPFHPSSYLLYLCTKATSELPAAWREQLARHDVVLVRAVIDDDEVSSAPTRIALTEAHAASGFSPIVEFFRRELAPTTPKLARSAMSTLFRDVSRRELRLVARHCIDDALLDEFLFEAELERGRLKGSSLHERLIDLLHIAASEGLLDHFCRFLAEERERCVRVQMERLRTPAD